jgi:hypothetical protein
MCSRLHILGEKNALDQLDAVQLDGLITDLVHRALDWTPLERPRSGWSYETPHPPARLSGSSP